MHLKAKSKILLTVTFFSTLMNFYNVSAVCPPMDAQQFAEIAVRFDSNREQWDEQKLREFFKLSFTDPENGKPIPANELELDCLRMQLFCDLLGKFSEIQEYCSLTRLVDEYGYKDIAMRVMPDLFVNKSETKFSGRKSSFEKFHEEAYNWNADKLSGDALKTKINQFLDKFALEHADYGGINAQNCYGNTILHDAVRFFGSRTGGKLEKAVKNISMLNTFIECLLEKGIDPGITNNTGKIASEVANVYKIKLPLLIQATPVSRCCLFDEFYGKANKWNSDGLVGCALESEINLFLDKFISDHAECGGINAKDVYGNTILHVALPFLGTGRTIEDGARSRVGIDNSRMLGVFIKCLLRKGIDPKIANYQRKTAIDVVKKYGLSFDSLKGQFISLVQDNPHMIGIPYQSWEDLFSERCTIGDYLSAIHVQSGGMPSKSTLGSKSLFNDFHVQARGWSRITDLEVLKGKINEFLDKFASENAAHGGINAQNAYGNTILHDSLRFIGGSGTIGIGASRMSCLNNPKLLLTFVKCLRSKGIDPKIVNTKGEKALDTYNSRLSNSSLTQIRDILEGKIRVEVTSISPKPVSGSKYLFKDFHIKATQWSRITDKKVLEKEINEFLDKFESENAAHGGINAQNAYGNTILHDSLRFIGGSGTIGIGASRMSCLNNLELLLTFVKCLRSKGIDPKIVNTKGENALSIRNCHLSDFLFAQVRNALGVCRK